MMRAFRPRRSRRDLWANVQTGLGIFIIVAAACIIVAAAIMLLQET